MVYLVAVPNVKEMDRFNFTATVLDNIDTSVASSSLSKLECLNTASNFSRLFVLNVEIVVSANACKSELDLVVRVELYFTVVDRMS